MIKTEKTFKKLLSPNVEVGKPCILELMDGHIVRTSRVEDWNAWHTGDLIIKTKNSIYRGTTN